MTVDVGLGTNLKENLASVTLKQMGFEKVHVVLEGDTVVIPTLIANVQDVKISEKVPPKVI